MLNPCTQKMIASAAVAAVVAGGITALGANAIWPNGSDEVRIVVPVEPLPFEGRYLAIGDSYAAGEGVEPFVVGSGDRDGDDRCHRSTKGYAYLLQFAEDIERDNRACTGAEVVHLTDVEQEHDGVPNKYGTQLGEVPVKALDDDVSLITVSIGGNDAGFKNVLIFCAKHKHCVDRVFRDGLTLGEWADQKVSSIAKDAGEVYRTLEAEAPNARIVVLGYPHLFPTGDPAGGPTCVGIAARYGDDERAFVRTASSRLNDALQAEAIAAGVDFIPTKSMFSGHEQCGTDDDWINTFKLLDLESSFHPDESGQRAYAALIWCYLLLHPDGPPTTPIDQDDLLGCALGVPQ